MRYLSPLRYPGGKARLAPYVAALIGWQSPPPSVYAEPFAGGAGVALRLLVDGDVQSIHINDLDPGIAAFWRSVFSHPQEFARLVETAPITIDAWRGHRRVYEQPGGHDDLTLGFATFFLNRTSRSGILNARPIGGFDQSGAWKIDARFNREALAHRIRFLGSYASQVFVTELDAREMLRALPAEDDDYFVYVDPPYLVQGNHLYMSNFSAEDHAEVAQTLSDTNVRWFLTYDADARVTAELYKGYRCIEFDIHHTAHVQHLGQEFAVFGNRTVVPEDAVVVSGLGRWVVRGSSDVANS